MSPAIALSLRTGARSSAATAATWAILSRFVRWLSVEVRWANFLQRCKEPVVEDGVAGASGGWDTGDAAAAAGGEESWDSGNASGGGVW